MSLLCRKRLPKQTKLTFRIPSGINDIVGIDLMEIDEEDEYQQCKFIAVIRDMFSGAVHLKLLTRKTPDQAFGAIIGYC